MIKKSLFILIFLLFFQFVLGNVKIPAGTNIEGNWFSVNLPQFYEQAVEIVYKEEGYEVIQTIGNSDVPSGKLILKMDHNFENCKNQVANKGFVNPRFVGCNISSVSNDLITGQSENGVNLVFFRDLPASKGSLCITDLEEKIPEQGIEKILELRPKAFKHCLACEGTECKMRKWPEGRESESLICKKLFCKPVRAVSVSNLGSGITEFEFNFIISKKGNIENINITSTRGVMSKNQAKSYTQILSKQEYLPLEINGTVYELRNLRGWLRVEPYR